MTEHEQRALMKSQLDGRAKAIYEQYGRYLYAVIFRTLRDCGTPEDVEDCFAETFAEIISHLETIRTEDIKAYIGRAGRNRAINYARSLTRQRQNTVPLEDEAAPSADDLQASSEDRALQRLLLEKIKQLGEPDATIVMQKYYFNRPMKEIAKTVGLSPHNAQVRCGRALKRLRKELEDWR